jgi:hypothetical protein
VQAGFTLQLAFDNQFPDQFQLGIRGMRTHSVLATYSL